MIKYLSHKLVKAVAVVALAGLSGAVDAQAPNWSQAGPIYNAGRSRNMVVDKNDPSGNTLYVGSASSGVFKSTDGGVTWNAIPLTNNKLNVSYIAQATDGTIYVATGEGFLRPGQKTKALPGTGLYKISGGAMVSVASNTMVGTVINRVACSPIGPGIIALATDKGIMVSNDGGANFNLANGVTTYSAASGQDLKFDGNGLLYCSYGAENALSAATSSVASKVYKSTDNTLSQFNPLNNLKSTLIPDSVFGRIELSIAPSNNSVIYASCASKYTSVASASLKGLFVSYDSGANWGLILQGSSQLDPLTNGGTVASGDYAQCVTVNPYNSDQIFYGSYQFYIWTKTGGSSSNPVGNWVKPSLTFNVFPQLYIAPNIHDIKLINTGSSISYYYFVTDAGIYRSADGLLSFQPFYQGLITGQFNSVSIERFPLNAGSTSTVSGTQVIPYSGFIGGTGGNGLNYFSGAYPLVTKEVNYTGGDVYQSEFSKILPNAAYFTQGTGKLFRTSDVRSSDPNQVDLLAKAKTQDIVPYDNAVNYGVTGTPFKIWENYGQVPAADSAVFYNDTLRFAQSMQGVATLTTQTTFTFSAARPNRNALIDSIVVRTGTVVLPISSGSASPAFSGSDKKDITISMNHTYTAPATGSYTVPIGNQTGPVNSASTSVILNSTSQLDNISITFTSAPFAAKTTPSLTNVPDAAAFYRVFCTVFYKYKTGDSVFVVDDKISTKTHTYSAVLSNPLNWDYYGSVQSYTMTAPTTTAVSSPTYVLNPGNVAQSNPTFVVTPLTTTAYTISAIGSTTITGKPVTYTINAVPAGTATIPSPTYVLMPGAVTQTNTTFTVQPTATTNYTITESSSSTTVTSDTYSTIVTSTYNLVPGNITQSTPVFTVNTPITYTITGLSSNTLIGANTSTTGTKAAANTFSTLGYFAAQVPNGNKPVKIAKSLSARIAMGYGANVYVSNAPLNLNNPLSMINISANKCLTTDANGNKLTGATNTVAVSGTVTALEWSKSGTELYYATNDPQISGNKFLYRVSYIDALLDSTARDYSGKLHTNIFVFNTGTVSSSQAPDGTINNPRCPYRTTLLGSFGKIITSISVTKDDKAIAITFDNPTGTKLMYSTVADVRKCDSTNIVLQARDGGVTSTSIPTSKVYCSLMEQSDNKKVFVGTDFGVYYTNDITAPTPVWQDGNNNQLPVIQVLDLKQQTMRSWECYNAGVILAATNGRGIWVNKDNQVPYYVGVKEQTMAAKSNNLSIYPNPTNGTVYISFSSIDGENASLSIMDINGKIVQKENMGKLTAGQLNFSLETNELASGMYIVSINSDSGVKRVAKLVVTK